MQKHFQECKHQLLHQISGPSSPESDSAAHREQVSLSSLQGLDVGGSSPPSNVCFGAIASSLSFMESFYSYLPETTL